MTVVLLLSSLAQAGDVVALQAGQSWKAKGPSACMDEARFTQILVAEQALPLCHEQLDRTTQLAVDAVQGSVRVLEEVDQQLSQDEVVIQSLQSDLARAVAQRDQLAADRARLKSQRNTAVAVASGFLVAAAAATVLAL